MVKIVPDNSQFTACATDCLQFCLGELERYLQHGLPPMYVQQEDYGAVTLRGSAGHCPGSSVRTKDDFSKPSMKFGPEFTHQFFGENETIFGYSDLMVNVYVTSGTLDVFVELTFSGKLEPTSSNEAAKPDDIVKIIQATLPEEFRILSIDEFMRSLDEQLNFRPFGEMVHSCSITKGDSEESTRQFQIFKSEVVTPLFAKHFDRVQSFALWFIDAASYLDLEDEKWKYFIAYEKYRDPTGVFGFAFAGYAAVYEHWAYPQQIRPRIGHILVLPPYQSCGLGVELLQAVYRNYVGDKRVVDISAEDPSDDFLRLRNFVDCLNCTQLPSFQPNQLVQGFSDRMASEAKRLLKMPPKQARIVYEILRLKHTNVGCAKEFRSYRLAVKQRLNIPYQKSERAYQRYLAALNDEEQKEVLEPEEKLAALQKLFDETMVAYKRTLHRLALSKALPISPATAEAV